MADGETKRYVDDAPDWLYLFDHRVHQLLPVVIAVLFVYLGVYFFTSIYHIAIQIVEISVLFYFVLEVVLAYILYESRWDFLRDKWLNILLILPFLAVFRTVGRVGQLLGATQSIEALRVVQLTELPVVSQLARQMPTLQKVGHGIIDLPKVLKKMNRLKAILPIGLASIAVWNRLRSNQESEKENVGAESDESRKRF